MSAAEAAAVAPTSMYARAPLWRRLIGFNVLTGIALGVVLALYLASRLAFRQPASTT